MSQQQTFFNNENPTLPNIQFIQGTSGSPVGPNPATFTISESSSKTSNDLAINGDPSTYDLDYVNITKYTPYIVDLTSFISVINFNINFVASNSIVATVDSVALTAVPFNTNQATTIQDLATQISGASGVISAVVTGTKQITVSFSGGVHTVNSVVTTGGASQPTATINQSINAPYYTIQSAINAAHIAGGGVVAVKWNIDPYIENLTLYGNVDVIAVNRDSSNTSSGIIIQGNVTLSAAGIVHMSGFYFSTPSGDTFTVTNSSGIGILELSNCQIDNSAGIGFNLSSTGTSVSVICNNVSASCGLQIGNLGAKSDLELEGGSFVGGTGVAGFSVASATLSIKNSSIEGDTSSIDITDASGSVSLTDCNCSSNGPIINYTAAGTASVYGCVFDTDSGGSNIVTGSGTLNYANISSVGTANAIDALTTQVVADWKPYSTDGDSSTAIKGTSSFNSDDFSVVDGFVSLSDTITGTAQTIGAVTANTITFDLGLTPACYQFTVNTVGFEPTNPAAESVSEIVTVRTDGSAGTIIGVPDFFTNVESPLIPATYFTTVVGNDVVVSVLGSIGVTINWLSKLNYIKVS